MYGILKSKILIAKLKQVLRIYIELSIYNDPPGSNSNTITWANHLRTKKNIII